MSAVQLELVFLAPDGPPPGRPRRRRQRRRDARAHGYRYPWLWDLYKLGVARNPARTSEGHAGDIWRHVETIALAPGGGL